MALTIQYIIIALIFIAAITFIVRKFMPSKSKGGSCNKGCGCDFSKENTVK